MRFFYINILFFLTGQLLFSQKSERKSELRLVLSQGVYLKKADNAPDFIKGTLHFRGINKYPYYENKSRLKAIKKAEKTKNYRLLNRWLTDYVSRFGIENFKKEEDLELLWKLGNVRELLGDTTGALFFYRIALNNHPSKFAEKKQNYKKLRAPYFNEYVNLDFYYQIVKKRKEIDTLISEKKVLLKLPPHINTEYPEYAPYMHPRGDVLIFTRRKLDYENPNAPDPFNNEDLYFIEKSPVTDGWKYPEKFTDEINSEFNEGSACLNVAADLLIFVRCNAPDGFGSCDLYSAEYKNGKWVNVQNLGENINSEAWDSHPSLSPDGNTLYFASNRNGGFGNVDVYMSEKKADGTWGKAKNLGPLINTAEDDLTPFIHPVNNTLYFASSGHLPNFGGYDIFKSRKVGDIFEVPRNLGPLINSDQDEFYFTISGQGDKIFFAKSVPENPLDYDLYSYPMPMGARPDATTPLKGYLIDSATGNPLTGIITAVDLEEGIAIEPLYINSRGYFEFRLINNRKYLLLVYNYNAITINDNEAENKDSLFALLDKSIIYYKPVIFESLEFPKDEAKITKEIEKKLKALSAYLETLPPNTQIKIFGHTDNSGSSKYNLKLSQKRAEVIKEYILKHTNLKSSQIITQGFGETQPVFPNDTEEHRAKNRRVEFIIEPDLKFVQKKRMELFQKKQADILFASLEDLELLPDEEVEKQLKTQKPQPETSDNFLFASEEEFEDSTDIFYKFKRDTIIDPLTTSTEFSEFDEEFQVITDIEAKTDTSAEADVKNEEFEDIELTGFELSLNLDDLDDSLEEMDNISDTDLFADPEDEMSWEDWLEFEDYWDDSEEELYFNYEDYPNFSEEETEDWELF